MSAKTLFADKVTFRDSGCTLVSQCGRLAVCRNPLVPRGKGRVRPAPGLSAVLAQEGGQLDTRTIPTAP